MLKVKPDQDLLDLIPKFIENTLKTLWDMKEAAELSNIGAVSYANHQIRGCALSYGFKQLHEFSLALSNATSCKNLVQSKIIISEMLFFMQNVSIEIEINKMAS